MLKILIRLESLNNLIKNVNTAYSRFNSLNFKNLNRDRKKACLNYREKFWQISKVDLDRLSNLDLDWSGLSRPPGLPLNLSVLAM
jgi:hypothetical protein